MSNAFPSNGMSWRQILSTTPPILFIILFLKTTNGIKAKLLSESISLYIRQFYSCMESFFWTFIYSLPTMFYIFGKPISATILSAGFTIWIPSESDTSLVRFYIFIHNTSTDRLTTHATYMSTPTFPQRATPDTGRFRTSTSITFLIVLDIISVRTKVISEIFSFFEFSYKTCITCPRMMTAFVLSSYRPASISI